MSVWYSALRRLIHAQSPLQCTKRITQLVTAGCRLYVLVRVHVCLHERIVSRKIDERESK